MRMMDKLRPVIVPLHSSMRAPSFDVLSSFQILLCLFLGADTDGKDHESQFNVRDTFSPDFLLPDVTLSMLSLFFLAAASYTAENKM